MKAGAEIDKAFLIHGIGKAAKDRIVFKAAVTAEEIGGHAAGRINPLLLRHVANVRRVCASGQHAGDPVKGL